MRTIPRIILLSISLLASAFAHALTTSFIVYGDFGSGAPIQFEVAAAMRKFCQAHPCEFSVGVGDNFYPSGVASVTDPQFTSKFEAPYGPLGLRYYASLGNHDTKGNVQAQIDYTKISKYWYMPDRYYAFERGNIQFVAINTESSFDFKQMYFVYETLHQSKASWKIVYGHRPIYTVGKHGNNYNLWWWLLPLVQGFDVDFYLAGHDHTRQLLTRGHHTYVISGAAGDPVTRMPDQSGAEFASNGAGFVYMMVEDSKATVSLVDGRGEIEFSKTYPKVRSAAVQP